MCVMSKQPPSITLWPIVAVGNIPTAIGGLVSLRQLSLTGNQLTGPDKEGVHCIYDTEVSEVTSVVISSFS